MNGWRSSDYRLQGRSFFIDVQLVTVAFLLNCAWHRSIVWPFLISIRVIPRGDQPMREVVPLEVWRPMSIESSPIFDIIPVVLLLLLRSEKDGVNFLYISKIIIIIIISLHDLWFVFKCRIQLEAAWIKSNEPVDCQFFSFAADLWARSYYRFQFWRSRIWMN